MFFVICLGIYFSSMAPSYNSDDSPETSAAYYTLGIQHPPGYPLATLIGRIIMIVPLGSPALRANMLSAILTILTGLMIFLFVNRLLSDRNTKPDFVLINIISFASAAFFIFSSSVWLQGSIAKGGIYTLNSFLLVCSIYSLFKIHESIKYFYLFALLYGLSMGNHWTSMIVIAPAIAFYLIDQRKYLSMKHMFGGFLFFLLGLTVFLYIPIRNMTGLAYAWGDVKSIKDFIWLISRAQYAGIEIKHSFTNTSALIIYYIKNLFSSEFPLGTALLIIPGIVMLLLKQTKRGLTLLAAYLLIVISVASFATPPNKTEWLTKPYLLSTNFFAVVFMVCSIYYFALTFKNNLVRRSVALFLTGPIVILLFAINKPDYERYYIGYDFGNNLVKTIKQNSIIFLEGDMYIGSMIYKSLVDKEKFVPVIPVVSLYGWYQDQVKRNFSSNINMPATSIYLNVFIDSIIKSNPGRDFYYSNVFTKEWLPQFNMSPQGLAFKIGDIGNKNIVSENIFKLYSFRGLIEDKLKSDEFTRRLVIENYAMGLFNLADNCAMLKNYKKAAEYYERGLIFYKGYGAYANAGLVYYKAGEFDKAELMWQEAIKINPNDALLYTKMVYLSLIKNNIPKAKDYIQKVLQLEPENKTALSLQKTIK